MAARLVSLTLALALFPAVALAEPSAEAEPAPGVRHLRPRGTIHTPTVHGHPLEQRFERAKAVFRVEQNHGEQIVREPLPIPHESEALGYEDWQLMVLGRLLETLDDDLEIASVMVRMANLHLARKALSKARERETRRAIDELELAEAAGEP
jgi:hypothetical protein